MASGAQVEDVLIAWADEHIPDPQHAAKFIELLEWVKGSFPQLDAQIKWNQPMFIDHGTFIIGFSVSSVNILVGVEVPTLEAFSDRIQARGYSRAKKLWRIGFHQEIPCDLLQEMIQLNIMEKANYTQFWR